MYRMAKGQLAFEYCDSFPRANRLGSRSAEEDPSGGLYAASVFLLSETHLAAEI